MNKEFLNEITISNCFDDKYYPNWDNKLIKCPSNNKVMCKEFNKRNPNIPRGWFSNENDEKYYCIGVRHARCEFNSDTYFEMENHILDQRRFFFLQYVNNYCDRVKLLIKKMYERDEDDIKYMYFIVERINDLYLSMEIFLKSMAKKTSIGFHLYEHVDYFIENKNKELKEYLMYLCLEKDMTRTNGVYQHYYCYQKKMDYVEPMDDYIELQFRRLMHFVNDLRKLYVNVKLCKENLCYCCFELNEYKLYKNMNEDSFVYEENKYANYDKNNEEINNIRRRRYSRL